jgi:hypothetical protein
MSSSEYEDEYEREKDKTLPQPTTIIKASWLQRKSSCEQTVYMIQNIADTQYQYRV